MKNVRHGERVSRHGSAETDRSAVRRQTPARRKIDTLSRPLELRRGIPTRRITHRDLFRRDTPPRPCRVGSDIRRIRTVSAFNMHCSRTHASTAHLRAAYPHARHASFFRMYHRASTVNASPPHMPPRPCGAGFPLAYVSPAPRRLHGNLPSAQSGSENRRSGGSARAGKKSLTTHGICDIL